MRAKVTISASDGHRLEAWRSDPAGQPKGGVVVLHAIFGLTEHIGDVCDRWAAAGYTAIAPALYDRIGKGLVHPYQGGNAAGRDCYAKLTEAQILADVEGCAAATGAARRIVSGFCTGGTWAWTAAARLPFDAQVNFYGSHVASRLGDVPWCPTVMHYGDRDHIVPLPDIDRIRAARPEATVHIYPGAGHAFFNPEQETYDRAAAEQAWANTLAFLG